MTLLPLPAGRPEAAPAESLSSCSRYTLCVVFEKLSAGSRYLPVPISTWNDSTPCTVGPAKSLGAAIFCCAAVEKRQLVHAPVRCRLAREMQPPERPVQVAEVDVRHLALGAV